jgi:radical SAM protein (TIGR01212 family)
MKPPYRTFSSYLRERFGTIVYRVPIDAGFDCPNRDGNRAFGGCTFCDERGSGAPTMESGADIKEQVLIGIERMKRRYRAKKYLAYFQAFTNTYAPEGILRALYDAGLDHPDVVGLCIGTRPDCLPDNVLDLLAEYAKKTFVWLEVGLQSAFNPTLDRINRAHTAEEFFDAVTRAKQRNLNIATHLIFGLPGETREHMMETVRQVAATPIEGIKIHQLCIYKGTPMEMDYRLGHLQTLEEDDYVQLVADSLEMLPPEMIVMRLVAEGTKDEIVAPAWCLDKRQTTDKINAEMARRGTKQGSRYLTKSAAPMIPA